MGAGKSTVGRLVAARMKRRFVDLDTMIEEREGSPVSEIFREHGEGGFRRAEHDALRSLEREPAVVVATGGGVVLREDNRALLRSLGTVVYLSVTPEEAIARVGDAADRPLLAGAGISAARTILDARLGLYTSTADHVIDTVGRSAEEVAGDVASVVGSLSSATIPVGEAGSPDSYSIVVGPGLIDEIGARIRDVTGARRIALVTDEHVRDLVGDRVTASIERSGATLSVHVITPGERSKSWETAGVLLEEFAAAGLDRGGCVVALGGGVVGDIAGFCAATYMRGVQVVQVPTTLLAQVDSAIGGKTAVDLRAGKNLAGAFWPPRLVLADTALLETLPASEWTNGLVEAAKAAVLAGDAAFELFESRAERIMARDATTVEQMVHDAAAFKAAVVNADLRESDIRECLNLGHTLGHALEMLAGYDRLPHGLAVAEGMRFAMSLSVDVAEAPRSLADRVGSLVARIGASREAFVERAGDAVDRFTPDAVLAAMKSDKKARSGAVRFVMVERPGSWRVLALGDDVVLRTLEAWRSEIGGES
jgi:3-dehydroquinate synthase